MSRARANLLVWFGVLGGPLAWAAMHVAGYAVGLARCDSPNARFQVPLHGLDPAFSIAGVAIGVLAELAALRVFLDTRESGEKPPAGRIHFLSVVGLTVNPLAVAIMILAGVGTAVLPLCQQS
jgi:hypothetical protein